MNKERELCERIIKCRPELVSIRDNLLDKIACARISHFSREGFAHPVHALWTSDDHTFGFHGLTSAASNRIEIIERIESAGGSWTVQYPSNLQPDSSLIQDVIEFPPDASLVIIPGDSRPACRFKQMKHGQRIRVTGLCMEF